MKSYQRWIWQLPEWPALAFDAQRIQAALAAARTSQGILLGKAEAIGLEGLQPHIRDSLTQEALTTSAIEGEKLDPESVRSSVARRLGLDTSGAPVREGRRNIEGLIDVLQDATLNTDAPLTLERLCSWHAALFPTGFSGMQRIDVGALRSVPMEIVSGAVGHSKVHYAAPPAEGLAEQVDSFLNWFNQTQPKVGSQPMDGLVRAAVAHLWFETLHPFDDGNGRISRAVGDMALARAEGSAQRFYSLSAQIQRERKQYYEQLEATQRGSMDVTPWLQWFLACLLRAVQGADGLLVGVLDKAKFWQRWADTPMNARQTLVLNRVLDGMDGKLTNAKWAAIGKCSADTALRDINDLLARGVLRRLEGGGRNTAYGLVRSKDPR